MFDTVFIYIEKSGQIEFFLKLVLKIKTKSDSIPDEFGSSLLFNDEEKKLYVSSQAVSMQEEVYGKLVWMSY